MNRDVRNALYVVLGAIGLGIVSLLSNIHPAMVAENRDLLMFQTAISYILNGVPWGILLIVAGMDMSRWYWACLLGAFSGELALAVHYGFGNLIGFFTNGIGDNLNWFIFAIFAGIGLGLLGFFARQSNFVGHLLKLSIPASLFFEPFYYDRFTPDSRFGSYGLRVFRLSAWLEIGLGCLVLILGIIWVLRNRRKLKKR